MTSLIRWAPDRHRSCRLRSVRHSVRRRLRQARPLGSTFWTTSSWRNSMPTMPLILRIRNTPMPLAFTLMVARKKPQLREACIWQEGPARPSYSKAMTLSSALSCVRSFAAISRALELLDSTISAGYPQRTAYVMTDSLTSIFLISKGLHNPNGLQCHKLRHLVFRIVQQLLASPHKLRVVKVRAHTGVTGNEAADRLAQEAQQGRPASLPFEAMGSSGRGLHWIQYRTSPQDEQLRNAADLKDHLLTLVLSVQTQNVLLNPAGHSVLRKVCTLLNTHGGIAPQIASHLWTGAKLTPFERSLAAQFWTNRLWTLVRQRKCFTATAIPNATCPYCRQADETADNVANRCNLPKVTSLIKRRHDEAVLHILQLLAILEGAHKDCTITCDARSVSKPAPWLAWSGTQSFQHGCCRATSSTRTRTSV